MFIEDRVICFPICRHAVAMVLALGFLACEQYINEPGMYCEFDLNSPYELMSEVLLVGDTARVTVVAFDGAGEVLSDFRPEWYSGSPEVVSVDSTGLVTARAPGSTEIRSASCSDWAVVRVIGRPASLQLSPDTLAMVPGNIGYAGLQISDAQGQLLDEWFLSANTRWRSTDTAVALVDTAYYYDPGLITAVEAGTASIIVSLWEATDTMLVTVARVDLGAPASGHEHSCALVSDSLGGGKAYCWGEGDSPLGRGSYGPGYVTGTAPVAITGETRFSVVSVGGATCGLTQSGELICWGSSRVISTADLREPEGARVVMEGTVFTQVSAGYAHSCARTLDGATYCWGMNGFGQLGTESTGETCTIFVPKGPDLEVSCTGTPQALGTDLVFESVHAGSALSCGLTGDGAVYCWGAGYGVRPTQVGADKRWRQVAVGGHPRLVPDDGEETPFLACGLDAAGTAYCWGYHWNGLGNGGAIESQTPVAVAVDASIRSLSVGESACGVTVGGDVYCWGGSDEPPFGGHTPVRLGGELSFETVSVGGGFACGLATDGDVYCWGGNQRQLGVRDVEYTTIPLKVEGQK
jgi:alpha-tubulin suppressor-like RCC1 family protein